MPNQDIAGMPTESIDMKPTTVVRSESNRALPVLSTASLRAVSTFCFLISSSNLF